MRTFEYVIEPENDGAEVGRLLKRLGYSRASVIKLKYGDGLFLNGAHIRTVDRVRTGDTLSVCFRESSDAEPNASLQAGILYDDEDIVVFDKPAGMPVHRSNGHNDDTLENLYAALYPGMSFHAVSRLDRNTSGIVVTAKNKFTASKLMSDSRFRPRKLYYTVIPGGFTEKHGSEGVIDAPIARESESIIKRTVRGDGDPARTEYRVIGASDKAEFLEISLVTGRTHQIRVHFSYLGFPLLGDDLYGGDCSLIGRQALHCGRAEFPHPVTGQPVSLTASLPVDMSRLLLTLGIGKSIDF